MTDDEIAAAEAKLYALMAEEEADRIVAFAWCRHSLMESQERGRRRLEDQQQRQRRIDADYREAIRRANRRIDDALGIHRPPALPLDQQIAAYWAAGKRCDPTGEEAL